MTHIYLDLFDTMIAIIYVNLILDTNSIISTETYLDYKMGTHWAINRKGRKQLSMRMLMCRKVSEYAGEDAGFKYGNWPCDAQNDARKWSGKCVQLNEEPLIQVLCDMEFEGIRIDGNFWMNTVGVRKIDHWGRTEYL